jgi:hypothetical protein
MWASVVSAVADRGVGTYRRFDELVAASAATSGPCEAERASLYVSQTVLPSSVRPDPSGTLRSCSFPQNVLPLNVGAEASGTVMPMAACSRMGLAAPTGTDA